MISVAVTGASGKMGETVCRAVESAPDMELVARVDPKLETSLSEALTRADVLVDFTEPGQALANIEQALEAGVHVVVGTTGFDIDRLKTLTENSQANVFLAPNFAIGAVLMMHFATQATRHMQTAEIVEFHHPAKLDSPSGTAKRTAELMQEASSTDGEIPIHSVRLPGLVASQEVIFGDQSQTLTIRHDTTDRECFMPGVLLAVREIADLEQPLTIGLEELLALSERESVRN